MSEETIHCQHCGAPLSQGMRFCGACGQPVSEKVNVYEVGPQATQPYAPEPPASTPVPAQPAQGYPAGPVNQAGPGNPVGAAYPPPEKPKNRYLVPGLILGALALCGCLCLAVFLALGLAGGNSLRTITRTYEQYGLPPVEVVPPEPAWTLEPTQTAAPTETAEPTGTLEAGATAEATPEAAATATAKPGQGPSRSAPGSSYGGVTFTLDPSLGSGAEGSTVPAQSGGDVPPWEVGPEHIRFTIDQYPLQGSQQEPQILVYPVDAYIQANPEVKPRIDELKQLLKDQPADDEKGNMPFLPMWNAGQMFHVKVKYLEGQGMRGVRYVTQFGQDVSPIRNDRMFYTFQGLTDDGKSYIVAILPVSSPLTPDLGDLSGSEYDGFAQNFEQYLTALRLVMNQAPNGIFTPDLDALDRLAQSITVK